MIKQLGGFCYGSGGIRMSTPKASFGCNIPVPPQQGEFLRRDFLRRQDFPLFLLFEHTESDDVANGEWDC
jgi:hypothetical protein